MKALKFIPAVFALGVAAASAQTGGVPPYCRGLAVSYGAAIGAIEHGVPFEVIVGKMREGLAQCWEIAPRVDCGFQTIGEFEGGVLAAGEIYKMPEYATHDQRMIVAYTGVTKCIDAKMKTAKN